MMALAFVRVNDGVFANEGNGIRLATRDDSATGTASQREAMRSFLTTPYRYHLSRASATYLSGMTSGDICYIAQSA